MWSIEIATELPRAQIDGFDISLNQLPSQHSLPEHIAFQQLNILEDIPEHLKGKYHIVHCRMVSCVIKTGDPVRMFRNLLEMLSMSDTTVQTFPKCLTHICSVLYS